jgi:hypothetical protein
MVSVLTTGTSWDRAPVRSSQKYKICICFFSAKPATLKGKNKDWLSRKQDNVSEWDDMSVRGLLFQ